MCNIYTLDVLKNKVSVVEDRRNLTEFRIVKESRVHSRYSEKCTKVIESRMVNGR